MKKFHKKVLRRENWNSVQKGHLLIQTFTNSDKKWSFIDSDIFHHNIFAFLTDILQKKISKAVHAQTTFGNFQDQKGTEKTNFFDKKSTFLIGFWRWRVPLRSGNMGFSLDAFVFTGLFKEFATLLWGLYYKKLQSLWIALYVLVQLYCENVVFIAQGFVLKVLLPSAYMMSLLSKD